MCVRITNSIRDSMKRCGFCTTCLSSVRSSQGLSQPCCTDVGPELLCKTEPLPGDLLLLPWTGAGPSGTWGSRLTSQKRLQVWFHSCLKLTYPSANRLILLSPYPNFFPINTGSHTGTSALRWNLHSFSQKLSSLKINEECKNEFQFLSLCKLRTIGFCADW